MSKPGVISLMKFGKRNLRIRNQYIREAIGEFFGTLIVGFMCVGAGGQFMVKTKDNGVESQIVPVLGITLGIMIAIIITGGVSGGHVNPAVSIGLAVAGELSWLSVPGYVISQFLGSIVGALLAWSLIHPSIRQAFNVANNMTIPEFDTYNKLEMASIFSPIKSPGCTVSNGLATELVLTCFLIVAICAMVDKQSAIKPPGYLIPLLIPTVIAAFCFAHGLPTGTLLNPARDMGPRIAAWILGWNPESIFMSTDWEGNEQHWWVVGLFGPILGGMLGASIYSFIIGPQVNLEHLEVADISLLHQSEAIRQVIAANADDNGGGNWRGSTSTTSISAFIPKAQAPIPNNVASYSSYSTNNNIITQAFQQQRSPFQGSLYPGQGYPSIINKGAISSGNF